MSILIKDMEMPKSCVECRFGSIESCDETEPLIIRCIVLDNFTHEVDWHEVCPLIEVPEHGRLIDADALEINDAWIEEKPMMGEGVYNHIQFVFRNDILYAPTIIPAEEDET